MTMNVAVIDGMKLPVGVEFPPLKTAKYSWEQYPQLGADELALRCWRSDILVVLSSAITREQLEKMPRLKLIIAAGEACAQLDQDAARAQGVELLAFPDAAGSDPAQAQDLCARISDAIDHYISMLEDNGAVS